MSQIKNCDTKKEKIVRSLLHHKGYRFRLYRKDLPGKPDIVLPKYKKIIFVHGCFWHRHEGCRYAYTPKSRIDFWENKFKKNIQHDKEVQSVLSELGWQVYIIWECETQKLDKLNKIIDSIFQHS
ncbi:Very short patch repair protein [Candidatus Venteria ishoeyi]|uniref:Very short patch repair protein n=2 Tax=Candidatus Venteria ishoeyi TaxID=1899563 RepID=A0A1H6F7B2_9GAMM|nr:Very short patch repair protein [Candidatus Venteria ishoeyi]